MYSQKSVGPRMNPWGTPVLTQYPCEDFLSTTTRSLPLLRKEEIKPHVWLGISKDLRLLRRWACQTLSKALDIASATVQVAPHQLKSLTILSDTTVRRFAVDQEDLKPYWKPEKRLHFSMWSTILLFITFSKTLLTRIQQLVYIAYIHAQTFISICITLDMCMLTCMLISLWVFKVFKSFFWFS